MSLFDYNGDGKTSFMESVMGGALLSSLFKSSDGTKKPRRRTKADDDIALVLRNWLLALMLAVGFVVVIFAVPKLLNQFPYTYGLKDVYVNRRTYDTESGEKYVLTVAVKARKCSAHTNYHFEVVRKSAAGETDFTAEEIKKIAELSLDTFAEMNESSGRKYDEPPLLENGIDYTKTSVFWGGERVDVSEDYVKLDALFASENLIQ